MSPCPICGAAMPFFGRVDFNRSGNDHFIGARTFPPARQEVVFERCGDCGFIGTSFFADWSPSDFAAHVYNDDYVLADPPFTGERPRTLAAYLTRVLSRNASLLDYGGGNGALVAQLRNVGFAGAVSYDPYHGAGAPSHDQRFDVVTAFEVVEHVSDQRALFRELVTFAAPPPLLVFSTLLQPHDVSADWWYICPRNGHLAFHTRESLRRLLADVGMTLLSLTNELHLAFAEQHPLVQRFLVTPPPPVSGHLTNRVHPDG